MALTSSDTPGATPVTVWALDMVAPPAPSPEGPPTPDLRLSHHRDPAPELSRRFYRLVGERWYWVDRSGWTDADWSAWVDRPQHHLWTCWSGQDPVGYFELEQQGAGVVELVYFGLVEAFHGRGIGRWLLGRAIDTAWALDGTRRLWLHTCSLDGPNARANYEARGFRPCGESVEYRLIGAPGPPPSA